MKRVFESTPKVRKSFSRPTPHWHHCPMCALAFCENQRTPRSEVKSSLPRLIKNFHMHRRCVRWPSVRNWRCLIDISLLSGGCIGEYVSYIPEYHMYLMCLCCHPIYFRHQSTTGEQRWHSSSETWNVSPTTSYHSSTCVLSSFLFWAPVYIQLYTAVQNQMYDMIPSTSSKVHPSHCCPSIWIVPFAPWHAAVY